jgi:hypothetical protein
MAEKSRLTAKYLASSFVFYRKAGQSCRDVFDACAVNAWRQVLLCGVSELGEIAVLRAAEADVDVVGTYDLYSDRRQFAGRPVWRAFQDVERHDACVLTDLRAPLTTFEHVKQLVGRERVLVPDILGISGLAVSGVG